MKLFTLPLLFVATLATNLPAAAPAAVVPAGDETVVEVVEATADGWRSFATSGQAYAFARVMQRRGYFVNVFYDPCNGWWVCEFYC